MTAQAEYLYTTQKYLYKTQNTWFPIILSVPPNHFWANGRRDRSNQHFGLIFKR